MNIFKRIWLSASSRKYYQELISNSGQGAAGYYTKLALLGALVSLLIFAVTQFSSLRSGVATVPVDQLLDYYPEELVLTWDKGELQTNVPGPYLVPVPESWQREMRPPPLSGSQKQIAHLAVIDTRNPLSVEQFAAYDTFIWFGQKQFMAGDAGGEVRILPYNNQSSFTLSRDKIEHWGEYAKTFFRYLPVVLLPLVYLGALGYFVYLLIYLLLVALLIWLILVIKKVPGASYALAYKLGLHLLTLPILVQGILILLTNFGPPFGLFSLFLLVLAAIML